ncbi:FAD-dependent oxidoreductase [Falsiroseomonas oryzae]|uniref:FAD-dependent oxidoreductase n=1 Tax=Falsiroseomonas oryzae TaxID=2766473 RepID=UPI0022EA2ADE|nr:FAD-dependent oxidoreductase [Roseomonas sp. MO-31]
MAASADQRVHDLVVVGCGVAGLSAAVAAAEAGARVAVLERAPREERGGQSRWTEAYLRMKSHTEVTDDFETMLAENGSSPYIDPDLAAQVAREPEHRSGHARGIGLLDPNVIGTFADEAGPTIAWLKGLGVRFDFLPTQFLTRSQPRLLPVGGGAALVEALAGRAETLGVAFHYETTAERLVQDEDGRVTGVVARTESGLRRFLGPVALAAGGFEGNGEMLTRYLGPRSVYLRPVCKGANYNRGEGIRMALEIGAAASGDFGSYHAEPVDPRSGIAEPSVFIFPYGILVNKEGVRFCDEAPGTVDAWYERVTRRIYEQPEGIAWVILDARHMRIPNYRLGIRTDKPPVVGQSVAELARAIGLRPEALEATVGAYNAACVPGEWKPLELDGLATRGLHPGKSNWATPIVEPPFHSYPIVSSNVFTFGGVKVDSRARVLDSADRPIPGLYAAGEVVGMYWGNYTGATSVLKGLVFGRLAGTDAARRRPNA